MANDLAALKAELLAGHPVTGAYSAHDATAAIEINVVNRTLPIPRLSGDAVFAATDGAEFIALTDHKQVLWMSFCGRGQVDPFGASNIALLQHIFGGTSATQTALQALRNRAVSRATELGFTRVRGGTIAEARALP